MNSRYDSLFRLCLTATIVFALGAGMTPALTEAQSGNAKAKQELLKRIYNARIQLERERNLRDNEARANALRRAPTLTADKPTVQQLRQDTYQRLSHLENNFRCLDVDVNAQGGNTVIICGGNSGDISGSNTSAGRDIDNGTYVTLPSGNAGGQQ